MNKVLLIIIALIATLSSCNKEPEASSNPKFSQQNFKNESNIYVNGNILVFEDIETFNQHLLNLKTNDSDEEQLNINYSTLGLDQDIEEGNFYTEYPYSKLFENSVGFTSLRSIEEKEIRIAMENDSEFNSIIHDPFQKSVLNSDGAVQVGCRTYFLKDKMRQIVIANNDQDAYNTVKNLENVHESIFLNGVRTYTEESQSTFFDKINASPCPIEKKHVDLRIAKILNTDGSYTLDNISFVDNNCNEPCYEWIYSDGSTSRGKNPNRTFFDNDIVAVRLLEDCDPVLPPIDSLEIRLLCQLGSGNINNPAPFEEVLDMFDVDLTLCLFTPKPDFGSPWTSEVLNWSYSVPEFDVESGILPPDSGEIWNYFGSQDIVVEICHYVEPWNPAPCCGYFLVKKCCTESICDFTEHEKDSHRMTFSNSEEWKIDVEGAVTKDGIGLWSFPGEIKSKMIIYRRENGSSGSWKKRCPDEARMDMWGTWKNKDENCKTYHAKDYNELHSHRTDCDDNQQISLDANGARILKVCDTYDGSMVSAFSIKVDGEWKEYDNGKPLVVYD